MTPGWQTICLGVALVLFVVAAVAAWAGHRGWATLVALGLGLITLVPLWSAAAAVD